MTSISPMAVTGVQHLVERAYRESGEHQYLRELLVNALEASATRIEFGPEWQAVKREGVYRLMAADNGKGMGPAELLEFLNTFGGGGKPIGDAHENFGVGAKTSLLPWNHAGVVVLSWTASSPEGAMVWLARDAKTGEYGAKKIPTTDGALESVVVPFEEWSTVRPAWLTKHGTVVVCLGNTGTEDTFLGKKGDGDIKAISAYLNKRLWEVPGSVEVYVQELRSSNRTEWPRSLAVASGPQGKPDRRWNRRRIRGARYYVDYPEKCAGCLAESGTVALQDGTAIDWFLWDGERPAVHSYAHKNAYIAGLYKGELYDTQQHASQFRSFGITQSAVRANLTLIARPPRSGLGSFGVYPDTARNSLKIQGTHRAGESLPWADWAQEFAQNLPEPIRQALAKAGPDCTGTLRDSQWKARLMDRFGSRWKTLRYVASPTGSTNMCADTSVGGGRGGGGGGGGGGAPGSGAGRSTGVSAVAAKVASATGTPARAVHTRGGLPDYEWTTLAELNDEDSTQFAAAWCPPTPAQPNGLIQLARDFSAIVEVKRYWQEQYPDHLADDVSSVIEQVYGEVMVARLAHSEHLVSDPCWGRALVDDQLRTQSALTMALLGLLSEEQVIGARLSGLGVRMKAS